MRYLFSIAVRFRSAYPRTPSGRERRFLPKIRTPYARACGARLDGTMARAYAFWHNRKGKEVLCSAQCLFFCIFVIFLDVRLKAYGFLPSYFIFFSIAVLTLPEI